MGRTKRKGLCNTANRGLRGGTFNGQEHHSSPISVPFFSSIWVMAQLSNCSMSMMSPGAPGCGLYDLNPPGLATELAIDDTSIASLVVNARAGLKNLILPSEVRSLLTYC